MHSAQGVTLALTAPEAKSSAGKGAQEPRGREAEEKAPFLPVRDEGQKTERWVASLTSLAPTPTSSPLGQQPTPAVISYFKGQPDEWQTGLPTYARLVYPDLWPEIDLVYYGTVDQLKGVEGDLLQLRRRISD